jgi:hypothetical protein
VYRSIWVFMDIAYRIDKKLSVSLSVRFSCADTRIASRSKLPKGDSFQCHPRAPGTKSGTFTAIRQNKIHRMDLSCGFELQQLERLWLVDFGRIQINLATGIRTITTTIQETHVHVQHLRTVNLIINDWPIMYWNGFVKQCMDRSCR